MFSQILNDSLGILALVGYAVVFFIGKKMGSKGMYSAKQMQDAMVPGDTEKDLKDGKF